MAFNIIALGWHQANDKPGDNFTPIWNQYLESGCVAKMTKEDALQQKIFFVGDLEEAVNEIEQTRDEVAQRFIKNGIPRTKAEERVVQMMPYEFLFVFLM